MKAQTHGDVRSCNLVWWSIGGPALGAGSLLALFLFLGQNEKKGPLNSFLASEVLLNLLNYIALPGRGG